MPPAKNPDLHGNVPDHSSIVLLLIDVINDLEFAEGDKLLQHALPMAKRLAAFKAGARDAGIPAIYVNDNFGRWQSNFTQLLARCLSEDVRGRPVAELLAPAPDDYFVLKPKHSAFFSTTLDILLKYLEASTLILTGMTGNMCILFSAADAHMRDFHLVVPADCVASAELEDNRWALTQMGTACGADVTPSTELDLAALARGASVRRHDRLRENATPPLR
jgi:nicotinamidase-related amidase